MDVASAPGVCNIGAPEKRSPEPTVTCELATSTSRILRQFCLALNLIARCAQRAAGHAPAARARSRARTNRLAVPRGAATTAASNRTASITGHPPSG